MRITKILVEPLDHLGSIRIIPIVDGDEQTIALGCFENGNWVFQTHRRGNYVDVEELKCLFIPARWGPMLRDALIRTLGPPDKDATKQELNATKYHLEDMRKIAFRDFPKG